jgi:poly(3-hydroxybutyrate) depolymerase
MNKRVAGLLVLVATVGVACGEEAAKGGGPCVPATVSPCACAGGTASTQVCNAFGAYDACQCGALTGAGSGAAGAQGTAGFEFSPTGTAGTMVGGVAGTSFAGDGAAGVMSFAGEGAAGAAGAAAGSGAAGTGVTTSGADPVIPTTTETCPTLATGNITVKGQQVQLWVGAKQADKKGAVFFYWHGTGSNSGEASLLGNILSEIQAEGGLVASFTTSTKTGTNTGNGVWYTGDFEMADIILACATQQLNIDTRRIYVGGCSAGGLQTGAMVYGRSSYIAGAMPNSGGVIIAGSLQDPAHVPSVVAVYGPPDKDNVGIAFETSSLRLTADIAAKGGLAVACNHGGGHCQTPTDYRAAQWQFLKDHPFGVSPDPYASGLPGFPSGCMAE